MTMDNSVIQTPSIFNIERRFDFSRSFTTFLDDLNTSVVRTSLDNEMQMMSFLEYCIRYWPYRMSAVSIEDYLLQLNVDMENPRNDTDRFLTMELLINLLYFAVELDERDRDKMQFDWLSNPSDMTKETERLIQNAEYILEQCCNMRIRKTEGDKSIETPKFYISKRDSTVDAVLGTAPELSEYLLGYLDVRNEKNSEYKEQTLTEMYKYMEKKRSEYKKTIAGSISESFFMAMNKLGIRHNTDVQVKIHYRKKISAYDKLFRMGLFVIQSEEASQYNAEIRDLCRRE